MLNKKVCKACINADRKDYFTRNYDGPEAPAPWTKSDDERWNGKIRSVRCTVEELFSVGVDKPVPKKCLYRLEQLVSRKNK